MARFSVLFRIIVRKQLNRVLYTPFFTKLLENNPLFKRFYQGWHRTHPFDREFGVDTSGYMANEELTTGHPSDLDNHGFGSSQPSVIRKALESFSSVHDLTFIDLGCGKGRVLIVASEFHFKKLVGIEIVPKLVAVATENALTIAKKFPKRPAVDIVCEDVLTYTIPTGPLIFYLYHPFTRTLTETLVNRLVELIKKGQEIYFISYNPVFATVFDQHPELMRYFAENIDYDASELGYGPTTCDSVIIWGPKESSRIQPKGNPNKTVTDISQGWQVTLR